MSKVSDGYAKIYGHEKEKERKKIEVLAGLHLTNVYFNSQDLTANVTQ